MSVLIDNDAVQMVFAQPTSDGLFEGAFLQYLRTVGAQRPILLLAFAPKAAGTYFRQAAIYALEGHLIRMCHAQGGRDGTPYLPTVLACCLDKKSPATVGHMHMQAFASNRHFLNAFGIKPVIMIRNLPDMLASYLDMLECDPVARAEGLNCFIPDDFTAFDRIRKRDFVIDIIAPWYASYFATWKRLADAEPKTVCVLRYPDFCAHPAETLHAAIAHAGFPISRDKCERAMARVWEERNNLRYNKGVGGWGRLYFSAAHFERLSRLLSYYPELDNWLPDLLGAPGPN